jgi:hypothetical protein
MSCSAAAGHTAVAANGMAAGGMAATHARSSGPNLGIATGPNLGMLASLSSIPPDPLAGMLPSYHPLLE